MSIRTAQACAPGPAAQAGRLRTAGRKIPHVLKAPLIAMNRRFAGLRERRVHVAGHHLHYLDGGRGEPVLLLHGIFAEKDHWVDLARRLTPHHRVIAPDLPGYGDSERHEDQHYAYADQVPRLLALMDALGLDRVHLAGSSMGATLAALLARACPQRVASLAFIGAPHGLRTPVPSDTDRLIDAGHAPLIAHDPAGFEALLDRLFAQRPWLPWPIRAAARADAIARADSNRRLWQEHIADRHVLERGLVGLRTPLLVLWGRLDRVFHASGVRSLRWQRPDADIQVLDRLGHLPMMEDPHAVAQRYIGFLKRHHWQ